MAFSINPGQPTAAQCPGNIDFENGSFAGWTCYSGNVANDNGVNVISLVPSGGPVPGIHTMFTASANSEVDFYGGFPVNCPNGSGHSIKLGNSEGGGQAEGVSYEFTIPSNMNSYSLIYHYAVVFQDPNHYEFEQPRMEIEITNITDNVPISCATFTFIPNGNVLPGFFISQHSVDDTPVWCKDWTAVSVNLDGHAGKTISMFFKTADCTFRRHFGYAYIDVNTECKSQIVGAAFCPDDTAVNVIAPYGYQNYTWYNGDFSQVLGHQQTVSLTPPPTPGSAIAVELIPYDGYGCPDTLIATLHDTLTLQSLAGNDAVSCNNAPVQIGVQPTAGLSYTWYPATGLNNPNISNPFGNPDVTTDYILTTRNSGGGCADNDTVTIKSVILNNEVLLEGKTMFCRGNGDSAVLIVHPADNIQWFRDDVPVPGSSSTIIRPTQSGTYHAMLTSNEGCTMNSGPIEIIIDIAKPGITYPLQYAVMELPAPLTARTIGTIVQWDPEIFLDDPQSFTPVFIGSSDRSYTIEIKTISGCVTVDTQLVKTVPKVELYVPGGFTPNTDGLNDILRPVLMGVKELKYFRIFDRWGQLLYETKTPGQGWDGRIRGTLVPAQVVVWVVEAVGQDGRNHIRKGTSMVIK